MRSRNIRISVRLNEREHVQLLRQVETSGLRIEPLVRKLILGLEVRPRPPCEATAILRELSAIGNNINQIAHVANAQRSINDERLSEAVRLAREAWLLAREKF